VVIATAVTAITLPLIGIYEFVGEPRPEVVAVAAPAGAEPFVEAGGSGDGDSNADSANVTASGDAPADVIPTGESAALLGGATDDAVELALAGAESIAGSRPPATVPPTTAPVASPPADEDDGDGGGDGDGDGGDEGSRSAPAPSTAPPATAAPTTTSPPTTAPPTTAAPTTTAPSSGVSPIAPFPYKASWPSVGQWEQMAQCESGGDWSIVTGNGYYGGLQFSAGSWHGAGGSGTADMASKAEQIYRGNLLWESQGWSAWPGCARQLGWL
jgi:Transglycosylase-like domain